MKTRIQFMSYDKKVIEDRYLKFYATPEDVADYTKNSTEGSDLTQRTFPEEFVNHLTDTNIYFLRIKDDW